VQEFWGLDIDKYPIVSEYVKALTMTQQALAAEAAGCMQLLLDRSIRQRAAKTNNESLSAKRAYATFAGSLRAA
jgi:hypothetical protein